jgi:ATP-dependent Clp protease adaptor protein ClpS
VNRLNHKVVLSDAENDPEGSDNDLVAGGTQTLVRPSFKTKEPTYYKVLMLNDDFTPREFVVHVLQKFFKKNEAQAVEIMLNVHNKGVGIAGVYTHEIAETKAFQVNEYSKKNTYPLKCTVEKE